MREYEKRKGNKGPEHDHDDPREKEREERKKFIPSTQDIAEAKELNRYVQKLCAESQKNFNKYQKLGLESPSKKFFDHILSKHHPKGAKFKYNKRIKKNHRIGFYGGHRCKQLVFRGLEKWSFS